MSAVDPRLSAQQAQGEPAAAPIKHHKEQDFNPALSTTSRDAMGHWLAAPITGKLDEVPGVAAGNSAHLLMVDGQAGRTEADIISNTYVPNPSSFLRDSLHLTSIVFFLIFITVINCLVSSCRCATLSCLPRTTCR